jgi:hypothetical protein
MRPPASAVRRRQRRHERRGRSVGRLTVVARTHVAEAVCRLCHGLCAERFRAKSAGGAVCY